MWSVFLNWGCLSVQYKTRGRVTQVNYTLRNVTYTLYVCLLLFTGRIYCLRLNLIMLCHMFNCCCHLMHYTSVRIPHTIDIVLFGSRYEWRFLGLVHTLLRGKVYLGIRGD